MMRVRLGTGAALAEGARIGAARCWGRQGTGGALRCSGRCLLKPRMGALVCAVGVVCRANNTRCITGAGSVGGGAGGKQRGGDGRVVWNCASSYNLGGGAWLGRLVEWACVCSKAGAVTLLHGGPVVLLQ